ncbi:hypothetical protein C3K47_11395 [Solitalea longa]|uniref:Outer membrane protein beta-barrel domain-containing protein n=2 Tax=Solitalea longa TaxID=2079460 RepID=A0A2S5A1B0_9SPHI|nr:hypothetical protein C3K47_11395 [Solitalea longa]
MQGSAAIGTFPDITVDENPGDIFSHLRWGAMLYLEATNNKWTISSDVLFMKLGKHLTATDRINSGEVIFKQLGGEVAVLRKFAPWFDAGVGIQYNSINAEITLNLNPPLNNQSGTKEHTETWVDPLLIARATFPLSSKWFTQFRASIGGSGEGSNLVWQLQGYATYLMGKHTSTTFGYRFISIDYDKGSGADRFMYDVNTFGPVLKFGYRF